jgi:hypothetical protein
LGTRHLTWWNRPERVTSTHPKKGQRAPRRGLVLVYAARCPGGGPKARGSKTLWMETIFPSLT